MLRGQLPKKIRQLFCRSFPREVQKVKKLDLNLKRLVELHGSGMPVADAVKLLNQRLSDPVQKEIAGFIWKSLRRVGPYRGQCDNCLNFLVNPRPL